MTTESSRNTRARAAQDAALTDAMAHYFRAGGWTLLQERALVVRRDSDGLLVAHDGAHELILHDPDARAVVPTADAPFDDDAPTMGDMS